MTDLFIANQGKIVDGAVVPSTFAPPLLAAGATLRYNDSEAVQRYNALELTLTERAFHGLEMQANYTWSKCLSNSLGYFGQYGDEEGIGHSQTNGGYFFFQNIYDQHNDIGRCITDVAGAFNGYLVYDLPFGHGHQYGSNVYPVVNQIIGGWSVASTFNIHSGFAISPAAPDNSKTLGGVGAAYRPNCISGVSQFGSGDPVDIGSVNGVGGTIGIQFLNPAAVREPAPHTFGNCGVGAFRGPSLAIADFSIIKAFPITEHVNLQFLAEFINLTNTPVFNAPTASCGPQCDGVNGVADSGTFGVIQSTDPGREIQFGLKLNF